MQQKQGIKCWSILVLVCIAYETITDDQGELPLLKPMSQVAGRSSIQVDAGALEKTIAVEGFCWVVLAVLFQQVL
ncbi:hypothetical protein [Candidatus Ruthia endofausta]|uniref:hypothetical protein n=1 Tax=Candidatus Ruthia endofausta TaxID=2738852 RepID=UPI001FEAB61C|nr:hypothetical protein [Candidatus Ruthia endofausta]